MTRLWHASMTLFGLVTAVGAGAECTVSADPGAMVRSVTPNVQGDAALIVSMSMVPKLTHLDYAAAQKRSSCDLGPLSSADDSYELWGDDRSGRERKALPSKKGQPIAIVFPIFDLMKAVQSAQGGKPATVEGYLLATITKSDLTGWRFYTAMPDAGVLRHDMADALADTGTAIFRNSAGGQTSIFVPKR